MVALVDDDDVGRDPLQPLDRLEPAKARADDHDTMARPGGRIAGRALMSCADRVPFECLK